MKIKVLMYCSVLVLALISNSCRSKSTGSKNDIIPENWITTDSIVQTHIYSSNGLLSTTLVNHFFLVNGTVSFKIPSEIIKTYDKNNNLIKEQEFLIKGIKKILGTETDRKYDSNNNMILETLRRGNDIISQKKQFFSGNHLIKQINLQKSALPYPKDLDLDSSLAHINDKQKRPVFDSSVHYYFYDKKGNLLKDQIPYPFRDTMDGIKEFYSNKVEKDDSQIITNYEKDIQQNTFLSIDTTLLIRQKEIKSIQYDYGLSKKTMSISSYDNKGNLVKKVMYKQSL